MKSKKFVLAGLVLLAAITMVLLPLSGCKNDTVPPEVEKQEQGDGGGSETDKNNTAAKLVSISVTPSARTVYSVGEKVAGEIEVIATYDDEEEKLVTGRITTDTSTLTQSAGVKTVTVSYKDRETIKTTTFTVTVFPEEVKVLTGYTNPNHTGSGWTYVAFGEWPQTIKAEGVDVDETKSKTMGMFTYYLGSDSNYYVKEEENANGSGTEYQYSNGEQAGGAGTSTKWFKVEPIVWRVLTTSYKAPEGGTVGEILLLAEKILTGGVPYYDVYNVNRTVGEATIYPNNYEHSQIRAWLNGLSYESKESEGATQSSKDEYKNAGFLQTAFTESARKLIADTSVDNSAASTIPSEITAEALKSDWNDGVNPYASDIRTTDKVFLLSEAEATTLNSGFAAYDAAGQGNTRIRVTTDYAKATGAFQSSTSGYGGWWWLRSPNYNDVRNAHVIRIIGDAYNDYSVNYSYGGVVPALSISLQ